MPLLSDAKSCFFGTTPVKKIYAGTDLVWPKGVYPDTPGPFDIFYFPLDNSTKGACPWTFYWDINNETYPFDSKYSFIPGKSGNCLHFDNDLSPVYANLGIQYNNSYNMCGFLEVSGVPVVGPPTQENTAGIACPAFSDRQLQDGYVDKEGHFWAYSRVNQEFVWYDIGVPTPSQYQGSRLSLSMFAECYFKLPSNVYESPDVDDDINDYHAEIACIPSTSFRLGIKVVEGNKAKVSLFSTWGASPSDFYEKQYVDMPEDPWVHVSVGCELKQSNDTANIYDFYYSFNGKVFKRTQQVKGNVGFSASEIQFNVKKNELDGNDIPYPDIDEIRTASKPLYTEDFNPV